MNATVKVTLAKLIACECAIKPALACNVVRHLWLLSLKAGHLLLNSTAVTFGFYPHVAIATQARMTRLGTKMLPARKQISTNFLTAPSTLIIRLSAKLSRFVFAAEAGLAWSYQAARWTRAGMALKGARMWTCRARFRTCLTARMWWK